MNLSKGTPLEFIIDIESIENTRSISQTKNVFSDKDMIHIEATFTLNDYNNNEIVTYYGILQFDASSKTWNTPSDVIPLTWPDAAETGSFKAYYIPGSNGVLQNGMPLSGNLSAIKTNDDPLFAQTNPLVYGHSIYLNFSHICTYLTLTDLEFGVSDEFWFTAPNSAEKPFNNAYRLILNGTALSFEFYQEPDVSYNNLVYIAGETKAVTTDQTTEVNEVSYFLQPDFYDRFSLCYPRNSSSTFTYLNYNYNNIGIKQEGKEPDLKANNTYILNITQSEGIEINNPGEEEGWDNEQPLDIDVKSFLEAIYKDQDYFNEAGVKIIEKTSTGTKLLHNVDFKNLPYNIFEDQTYNFGFFPPNINEGSVFDGDYHLIYNVGAPIFRYNSGTIKNLGINGVNTIQDVISTQYNKLSSDDEKNLFDNSRNGIICCWNLGTVSNVQIIGEIIFNVAINEASDYDGGEVHRIGGIAGSNTGIIENIRIQEDVNLLVKPFENKSVDSQVAIGGVTGQNAGIISDISFESAQKINNICIGTNGAFFMGGAAGTSSGNTSDIFLSEINIDSSQSICKTSYLGGLIGRLTTDEAVSNISTSLESSNVAGNIQSGQLASQNAEACYTGGLIGGIINGSVIDCRSICNISVPLEISPGATYATGGAFGRILSQNNATIEQLIIYGNNLSGPATYIGNFAGIVPQGYNWETNYNGSIILKRFENIQDIGASFSTSF